MEPEFIVGEVSKNWPEQEPGLLCQRLERVIAVNLERGYVLHQFSLHCMMVTPEQMNETVIAVFRRVKADDAASGSHSRTKT